MAPAGSLQGAALGITAALLLIAALITISEPSASAISEHADDGYWAVASGHADDGRVEGDAAAPGAPRGPPDWDAITVRARHDPSATWFRPPGNDGAAPRRVRTFRTQSTRADWRVTVKGALELLGLVETTANDQFDVFWGSQWVDHATFFDSTLRSHMQVNSIMGIASETLGDKELLGAMRSLCRVRHGPAHCEHIPEIYTMPMELHGFKRATARHTYWVKKDKAQWGNKGVSFITRHDYLPQGDYTLQRYLMMPLLWRGFKFDMRIWVVIASVEPLRVYMLQDGWARVASVRYNISELHYGEPCMHFTLHYCLHAKATSLRIFQLNDLAFRSGLPRRAGSWTDSLWPSLQRAVLKTILMAWPVLVGYERHLLARGARSRRFSFLSFDAMFEWPDPSEPPAPMILECNSNGFMMGSRIPAGWEYTVDALRLLGVAGYNRSAYQQTFSRVARATCDSWRCSAAEVDALQDLADESAHRGQYAHLWPPAELQREVPYAASFFQAGAGAGRWNELTLAFAKAYFEARATAREDAAKLSTVEAVLTESNRTQWDIFGVQDEWWQAKLAIKMHNRQLRESIMKAKGYFTEEEGAPQDSWWIRDGKVLALRRWRSTVAQLLKSANSTRSRSRRTLQIVELEAAVMAGTAQHGHARAGMRVSQPLPPPANLEGPQLSSGASIEDDDDDDTELVDDDGLELVHAPADNFHGRYFGAYRQSARNNRRDHFIAQIRWNGQRYCLGTYWTAVEAAKAYDWAARLIGGCRPRNFAADADLGEPPRTDAYQRLIVATLALRRPAADQERAEAACGSAERQFVGVSLHGSNKFRAHIRWRGEHYTLGYFPSAIAAAKAYDWAARQVGHDRRLNFATDADLGEAPTGLAADRLAAAVRAARLKHSQPLRAGLKDAESTFARRTLKRSAPDDNELSKGASAAKHGSAGKEAAAVQPTQPAAARPRIDRARLESKLVELLRLHELREDGLDLPALSECALRDIVIDLHWGRVMPPQPDAEACLAGYSLLDLKARVRVNMRIREIDEAGAYLKALTGDDGREMLLDLLSVL